MAKTLSTLFLLLTALGTCAASASNQCIDVLDSRTSSEILNSSLRRQYPELEFIISDPDRFILQMRERFNAQKLITPSRPHNFDFSEVGIPAVQMMVSTLREKAFHTEAIRRELTLNQNLNPTLRNIRSAFQSYRISELRTALKYYNELLSELTQHLESGQIDYMRTVELSYFYSRIIGYFDTRELSMFRRYTLNIDRSLNGFRQLKIEEEYENFKNRRFSVYSNNIATPGFMEAAKPFEDAFRNTHELETIWVPTAVALDRFILMRLMNKNINLMGITADPIEADGFIRPGGDFNNHDIRHESDKYKRRIDYINSHGLSAEQIRDFERKSEDWLVQLNREIARIPDPKLKSAVDLMVFNFHHDRGYPLMPSEFLEFQQDNVIYGLFTMLRLTNSPEINFYNPFKYFAQSHAWLTRFWQQRLAEEQRIILRTENPASVVGPTSL